MEKVKLGDICEISAGQGAPQGAENYCTCNEGTPFIKAGDLADLIAGKSESAIQCVSPIIAQKHKLKLYPQGSILFAKSGMSCMKGYIYRTKNPCYVVSHLAIVTPYKIDGDYLKYYFQYNRPNALIKDSAYPSISLQDISNIELDLPSLEEQKAIAERLDKVSGLIEKRKTQLEKLDLLIKSRFIEMFGDPVASKKKRKLSEIGRVFTGNTPPMKEPSYYESNDIPFIKPSDLSESGVTNIDGAEAYISEKARPVARMIPPNAVLVTCIGTIGKIGITARESCCNQQINFVVSNSEINSVYLAYCLTFFKSTLQRIANAPVVPIINKTQFSELEIPAFDMDKQNQFATFVEQVDKSKFEIQKSLEKLEILKKSLMQQYFG